MAILNIVLYPDDPLTLTAEPYADNEFGPDLAKLAADMLETMEHNSGVGLAGPQVDLQKRIFVLREPDGEPLCLVNPEILEADGSALGEEGCLSLPELFADVLRATRIRVRACDPCGNPLDFEARDFKARIIQHELDHLDGIIFLDRLDVLTAEAKRREWLEVRERLLAAAQGP